MDAKLIHPTRKILVVDDTAANLVAAEAALASLALPIITASSGNEALAHLLEHEFALALLDINMPGMDGYELAQWIRSRDKTQHLPIIFMTAHNDEASILRAYNLGAVDFMSRPVIPDVLRAKASVFVTLQERTTQLAVERLEREFENRRRDYETAALRRERDKELAAKQELARMNAALAEHDRRKDSFLAILAHELRNPLAPIQSALDLIDMKPDRPIAPTVFGILKRQTKVLTRLVDDLLDISRINAGKVELRLEAVDLVDVVEAAITTSRPLIEQRQHALIFDAPADNTIIVADPVRLSQIITNILNNAARYTEPGGRIEVAVSTDGDFSTISVRDNGIGIPAELQQSIFEMFVQERVRSDGFGGLGLGLALSRRLIEMHNGSILVRSEGRGHGSTFEIHLPRHGAASSLPLPEPAAAPSPSTRLPRVLRVVVIDDNEDARELIGALLTAHNFEVFTAGDGVAGLALIREHQPEVALVDLGLPRLDGVGVVETLRREMPEIRTRFIALTGYGDFSDRERTRDAGFHAHLVKPATAEALFACVAQQLE